VTRNEERRPPKESGAPDTANVSPSIRFAYAKRPGTPPPPDWRTQWQAAAADAAQLCAERRERVLAHPDLAQRLTEPPLEYTRTTPGGKQRPAPELWNGFVPPRTFNGALNDSPQRAALVAICEEAQARESEYIRALDVT
jgi:hypothetical protein